jgi:antitoxin component YwqK of YwqJK toxin-antitoxin module
MKSYLTFSLFLLNLSILCQAQTDEKIEVKAINRQFIKRKDTIYRFYAINPDHPLTVRPDRTYHWYKSDTILATSGGYDGRLLDGAFTVFYPDKNLEEEGLFRNGLRTGEWKIWYPGGKLHSIVHWEDGIKAGAFTEYDIQGLKLREGYYKNDYLSGKVREHMPNGRDTVIVYKDGKPAMPKQTTPDKPANKPGAGAADKPRHAS